MSTLTPKGSHGAFIFTAAVVVGCLAVGVLATILTDKVPSMVVSVVLACGVASLLYGILGGVTEAGFDFGPLKVGGSAAVLLGGVWLINQYLDPQLVKIRGDPYRFDFDQHARPADNWFAINENTGVPIDVEFTDPVSGAVERVEKPASARLRLNLTGDQDNDRYLVVADGAGDEESLGYVSVRDLVSAIGSVGGVMPKTVYTPWNLYLSSGELSDETPSSFRKPDLPRRKPSLRDRSRPARIRVRRLPVDALRCRGGGSAGPPLEPHKGYGRVGGADHRGRRSQVFDRGGRRKSHGRPALVAVSGDRDAAGGFLGPAQKYVSLATTKSCTKLAHRYRGRTGRCAPATERR